MVSRRKEGGFTVIEMLTVIGIISVLAAIIFPIVGSAKRKAKQAQCIANMHQIFVALKQFQLDEHRCPDFIAGPVQWVDSSGAYVPYKTDTMVPLEKNSGMVNGQMVSLFPEYNNDPNVYRCPVSSMNVDGTDYTTSDPTHIVPDPMYPLLNNSSGTSNRNGLRGIGPSANTPYFLYQYSSYDYQKPKGGSGDEAHYCPTRLNMNDLGSMVDADVERQLRWKAPPADVVVTWCGYHRSTDPGGVDSGSKDLVLFLDGRVRPMSSIPMVDWGDGWRIKPGT